MGHYEQEHKNIYSILKIWRLYNIILFLCKIRLPYFCFLHRYESDRLPVTIEHRESNEEEDSQH